MKLRIESFATIIEKGKNDYDYNGKKGTSYNVIAMQKDGDSVGVDSLPVTKDVYNSISLGAYTIAGYFDTRYNRVMFDSCLKQDK